MWHFFIVVLVCFKHFFISLHIRTQSDILGNEFPVKPTVIVCAGFLQFPQNS